MDNNVTITSLPEKCPNYQCTNRLGEGTFALVHLEFGTTKELDLVMCRPCAEALQTIIRDLAEHG